MKFRSSVASDQSLDRYARLCGSTASTVAGAADSKFGRVVTYTEFL
ncbi:MAG: hypothetical protein K2Y28_17405 [Burkholderiaceae bacterium]|nr:hypothetical protein [Burkholderiaceae bacterium]